MCCLCSASPPVEEAQLCWSTSFPAVPLLHLKVRFYIPSHTTFPNKMAPLRNSPSSLSQHDLLMCVCVCAFKNAKSVFNYVTVHEDFFFFPVGTFRSFSHSLSYLMVCVCVWVCVCVYGNICLSVHAQTYI